MTTPKKAGIIQIIPVFIAFFTMAFVDLVGTATNYVKPEFNFSNSTANLFTTMVFFWFLILSIPTSMLMNKIGRRKTVIVAIWVTVAAMFVPLVAYMGASGDARFALMVVSFCLLGMGNALMQVSLNPLMALFATGDRLASMLTTGQFVKAIASLIAPYIAAWLAAAYNAWWGIYAIYLVIAVVGVVALQLDRIDEPPLKAEQTSFMDTVRLLKDPTILLCFLAIVAHVGIDVGVNAQAPRILMEHTATELSVATFATMVYFIGRMAGSFLGGIVLQRISSKAGLRLCALFLGTSAVLYVFFTLSSANPPVWAFWTATFLAGFGNVNVFGISLARALNNVPDKQNEISGLMIMGLVGGAIIPPFMGMAADAFGQIGGVVVMSVCVIYVVVLAARYSLIEE
ncbi:MFS transporter [Alloscardovia macacae]|uniref:MFS transporter n=1 Tax=Alloscardovia macacae TaxID=1160091 RepID=UPI000A2E5B6C|nr:MFS transporter [Alloscardovia macacae]OTA25990.1 MFS transporter [Alloscardovia macacae]